MIRFLTLLFFTFCLFSCTVKQKPSAVKMNADLEKRINDFKEDATCADAHVDEMVFQDKLVYAFYPGTCGADMTTEVYSSEATHLGSLGGIMGNTRVNGEEFDSAKLKRTVWKR